MDRSFVSLLSDLQVVQYIKVACLSLLIFETTITLDLEYRYIWSRKWSFVKILYLYSRYSTFIDTTIAVSEQLDLKFLSCNSKEVTTFITIFSGLGIALTEILLMIRTYAIYNSSRRVLIAFIMLWLTIGGVNFWAVTNWSKSFNVSRIPVTEMGDHVKCFLGRTSNIGLVCYLSFFAGETIILIMTAIKAFFVWRFTRETKTKSANWVLSFYQDGIFFYFFLLPFTTLSILAPLTFPGGLYLVADTPLRVMHTILTCRMVLRVRCAIEEKDDLAISSIKFGEPEGQSIGSAHTV
ncbi:hypothetical protein VKT23_012580 [Stygiomarasmius scandens]|uniref:DUF6533 domain-containing protein n=1 Tax=Marasmiellus scandens TaxID=2682957 RepID=A0ABR1J867_9AGAR